MCSMWVVPKPEAEQTIWTDSEVEVLLFNQAFIVLQLDPLFVFIYCEYPFYYPIIYYIRPNPYYPHPGWEIT